MSLPWDMDASVDPNIEDLQAFEERNDVCELRTFLEVAQQVGDKKVYRSFLLQLNTLIVTLLFPRV